MVTCIANATRDVTLRGRIGRLGNLIPSRILVEIRRFSVRSILAILIFLHAGNASAQNAPTWAEVSQLFSDRCVICHSGEDAPLGLQLDSFQNAKSGGMDGPVLIAGDPDGSKLAQRIRGEITPRMPFDGPPFLNPAQIKMIEMWILAGLPEGKGSQVTATPLRVQPAPGEPVIFSDVQPIFLKRCTKCHSDNSILRGPPEGLRLDTLKNILSGGERLAVLPGRPEMSTIWRRIVGLESPRMPFDGPPWLSDEDIRLIRDWIRQGAPDAQGVQARIPVGARIRLRGILTARTAIDGATFDLRPGTRVDKNPRVGSAAEMRGNVNQDGTVRATRLRRR